jgi:hypothetical protein
MKATASIACHEEIQEGGCVPGSPELRTRAVAVDQFQSQRD